MDEKAIQDMIAGYRASREEWLQRRQAAMRQADECLARTHACDGAIEALEALLPAVPIEDVLRAVKSEV